MLVGILAVWFIGYAISIVIHPYRKCKVCNGTGKHVGAIYGRGFRPCRNCGGSSRRPRLGTRVREWRR
jgi:DnaJ-class molecular chaperone